MLGLADKPFLTIGTDRLAGHLHKVPLKQLHRVRLQRRQAALSYHHRGMEEYRFVDEVGRD
jgi:hypothetical protein